MTRASTATLRAPRWRDAPLVRRVLAGTGANAYAQAITIAVQLASLPLFLARWDLDTYGQWLVLSALPAYLAMADVGMVTAAGNRMTMACGEGRADEAERVFQSTLAFMLVLGGAMLVLVAAAALWWPAGGPVTPSHRLTAALLAATVLAGLLGGLPEAVYKATHRYALGTTLASTARLLEWAGALVGLWWGGSFVAVAAGGLAARVACTAAMSAHAAATTPALRWSLARAELGEVRRCAAPAFGFMVFPVANALTYQGMTLVCAATLGPAATVVFNTVRTLARVTVQATGTFSHALWPEFARLHGRGDGLRLGTLYRRGWRLGLLVAAVVALGVGLVAPAVLRAWSHGRIEGVAPALLAWAMAYAAVASAWHVPRVLLLSINRHGALAGPVLAVSLVMLPAAWAVAAPAGLTGLMAVMAASEALLLVVCAWLVRRIVAPAPPGIHQP